MKKILIVPLLFLAAACGREPPEPCMTLKESGTVVETQLKTEEIPCVGRLCSSSHTLRTTVYILVDVGGVGRLCSIDQRVDTLLKPGTKVNLAHANRTY